MNYFNTYDFDYTENYMALLACILNHKLTIGTAVKHIALDNIKESETRKYKRTNQKHNYKIKVLDEVESKEIEFNNLSDCCEFLNMRRSDITTYIKNNRLFRKRYRIQSLDHIKKVERKPLMIEDTLKNKTMEFKSVNKACEYLGAKRQNINEAIAAKRLFRKRYKIEYKVEIEKYE